MGLCVCWAGPYGWIFTSNGSGKQPIWHSEWVERGQVQTKACAAPPQSNFGATVWGAGPGGCFVFTSSCCPVLGLRELLARLCTCMRGRRLFWSHLKSVPRPPSLILHHNFLHHRNLHPLPFGAHRPYPLRPTTTSAAFLCWCCTCCILLSIV